MPATRKKQFKKRKTPRRSWQPLRDKRKQYRKSSGQLATRAGFGSVWSPFPPNMFTVISYTETTNLNQTLGGVPAVLQYRMNGAYDPQVAVGGKQPRYYDALLGPDGGTAPYRNYRVHASEIKVTVFNSNTAIGSGSTIVAVLPARSIVTNPTTIDEMAERPYCRQRAIGPVPSWKPPVIKHYTKSKYHLGVKDLIDVPATAAAYNSVPSEEIYWNILLCSVDPASTSAIRLQVSIRYFVQLYTLADVADS